MFSWNLCWILYRPVRSFSTFKKSIIVYPMNPCKLQTFSVYIYMKVFFLDLADSNLFSLNNSNFWEIDIVLIFMISSFKNLDSTKSASKAKGGEGAWFCVWTIKLKCFWNMLMILVAMVFSQQQRWREKWYSLSIVPCWNLPSALVSFDFLENTHTLVTLNLVDASINSLMRSDANVRQ